MNQIHLFDPRSSRWTCCGEWVSEMEAMALEDAVNFFPETKEKEDRLCEKCVQFVVERLTLPYK